MIFIQSMLHSILKTSFSDSEALDEITLGSPQWECQIQMKSVKSAIF